MTSRGKLEDDPFPAHWRRMFTETRLVGNRPCAVQTFLFTAGLLVDLTFDGPAFYGYTARYCFETADQALEALRTWDGKGDPPGPWIKEKVSERLGPGALSDPLPEPKPAPKLRADGNPIDWPFPPKNIQEHWQKHDMGKPPESTE